MSEVTPAKTVPLKFVLYITDYLDLDLTDVSHIEIDYKVVRVTRNAKDEFGRLFVGMDGEVGKQVNDYPLQTWSDYVKETNGPEDVRG